MEKQHTIIKSVSFSGIALHTGARATLCLNPAEINTGIVFRRVDLPGAPAVRALAANVVDVRRGTTIADKNGAVVYTVEHIMSALHAAGIDNCIVDMDGQEPPIADGSASPYWQMIQESGILEQEAEAKIFRCTRPLWVKNKETQVILTPPEADTLTIACTASFKGCPYDPQYHAITVTPDSYGTEIAGARTFVEYKDLEQLIAMGLCKGGSLDAAAILHNGAIICKDRLLWHDEIVRHKILDLIGDLYLCGCRVKANVVAIKPGHPRNVEIAGLMQKEIMENSTELSY